MRATSGKFISYHEERANASDEREDDGDASSMQWPINRKEWGPLGPLPIQGLQLQVNKHPFSKTITRSVRQAPVQ